MELMTEDWVEDVYWLPDDDARLDEDKRKHFAFHEGQWRPVREDKPVWRMEEHKTVVLDNGEDFHVRTYVSHFVVDGGLHESRWRPEEVIDDYGW